MSGERTIAKTVAGVPIYLTEAAKFTANFGRIHMERSRLREIEAAILAWASQQPTQALTITDQVPVHRNYAGSFVSGWSATQVTGHRDGRFRRGERGRDVIHSELFVHDPELIATLEEIAKRCQEAVEGYQREWEAARGRAVRLAPEHLSAPRVATR